MQLAAKKLDLPTLKKQGLLRDCPCITQKQGKLICQDDHVLINFASNDYLGLAADPKLIDAAHQAIAQYGLGGTSSQVVAGHCDIHTAFEKQFASFIGSEAALLFSNGYMANLGVITSLIQNTDIIFADKYSHASLLDAAAMTQAKIVRFQHLNFNHLQTLLKKYPFAKKWIVTDSVFSMQGDIAPLPELIELAKTFHAKIIVDDAHGIGVLGNQGRGIIEHFNLLFTQIDVLIAPLAKAFGCMGAMVCANQDTLNLIKQFSRSYMYTTAIPPLFAAAGVKALEKIRHGADMRAALQKIITFYHNYINTLSLPYRFSNTPIQTILIPGNEKLLTLQKKLMAEGFFTAAIRPPTVPAKDTCLRLSLTLHHHQDDIKNLLDSIARYHS